MTVLHSVSFKTVYITFQEALIWYLFLFYITGFFSEVIHSLFLSLYSSLQTRTEYNPNRILQVSASYTPVEVVIIGSK